MSASRPYAVVPTREGIDGVLDKAAVMDALARRVAENDREFVLTVREICKSAGNEAKAQVEAVGNYCKKLPYHREYGELFADPKDVLRHGGDCDDMVIVCLSALHALAIPCCPDVITKDGEGVHVRVRVGLPPTTADPDRTTWMILDPVEFSERQWSMLDPNTPLPQLGKSRDLGSALATGIAGHEGLSGADKAAELVAALEYQKAAQKSQDQGLSVGGLAIAALAGIGIWMFFRQET